MIKVCVAVATMNLYICSAENISQTFNGGPCFSAFSFLEVQVKAFGLTGLLTLF